MIEGKTETGFEFSFNDRLMLDVRLWKLLKKMKETGIDAVNAVFETVNFLLGDKGEQRLYEHIAKNDPDHIVDRMAVANELNYMLDCGFKAEGKN